MTFTSCVEIETGEDWRHRIGRRRWNVVLITNSLCLG
jgi:hypothetical protein